MSTIYYHCPNCDTPLDTREYDAEDSDDGLYDVAMECPACLWDTFTHGHTSLCDAWERAHHRLRQAIQVIRKKLMEK